MAQKKTIIVGMSGGVDSSVTAALLKDQGHEVIGLFMKNWEETDDKGVCLASRDFEDVLRVCDQIKIPVYPVEFIDEYKRRVFDHFIKEYKAGFTPNPDILCNREIKFKVFLDKAKCLGADLVATGHYALNLAIKGKRYLAPGSDPHKDQSYFLYTLKDHLLENVIFPLGRLCKSEVRSLASQYALATKDKKDSVGLCFIGKRNFKNFLSRYIPPHPGVFKTLDGTVVGTHDGNSYYTIGQRKGLGLGGPGAPWFVVDKIPHENIVVVERGGTHPALYGDELWAEEVTWVGDPPPLPLSCQAKIRYRQALQDCVIQFKRGNREILHVSFARPQRAITLRQSIVFYGQKEGHSVCLGGGVISERPPIKS